MVHNYFSQVAAEHPRACLNGMSWNPAISNQAIFSGSRRLIVGDSLLRELNEIFVNGQTFVLLFEVVSVAQAIKMMEFQNVDQLDKVDDISTGRHLKDSNCSREQVGTLLVCLLSEVKQKYKQGLVVLWAIPQNPELGPPVADFMNGNVNRWNEIIRNLVRSNPDELRLIDLENTLSVTRDRIPFNTLQELRWINDAFQTKVEEIEEEFRATDYLATTSLTGRNRARSNP